MHKFIIDRIKTKSFIVLSSVLLMPTSMFLDGLLGEVQTMSARISRGHLLIL